MKKSHLHILAIVFTVLFSFAINGCDPRMNPIVDDMVVPPNTVSPPQTEPAVPGSVAQMYTFHGTLDHQETIRGVAFSPDGETLASLGESSLKVWDLSTEQSTNTISLDREYLSIDILTGLDIFLGTEASGTIKFDLWSDGSLLPNAELNMPGLSTGHTGPIRSIAQGRTHLATGSSDRTLRVWSLVPAAADETDDPLIISQAEGQVWAVALDPFEQTLASGGGFEGIYLWDTGTGESKGAPLIADTAQVEGLAFSADGQTLAVATGLGTGAAIHLWDLRTNQLTETLMVPAGYTIRKVAISPDGQTIAGGAYDPVGPGVLLWKRK